jgi:four helix bundle protein
MNKSASFKKLDCWKEARLLTTHIYCISNDDLVAKDWDYARQIRRASISIMNNISEGFGRFTPKTFIQFLNYSLGSCCEVESMVILGNDLG